jgi:hypothetical protein
MPFRSTTTAEFRRLLATLPADTQAQAYRAFDRFLEDPFDRSIEFKRLRGSRSLYSARIGLHCRALAEREGDRIRWFWIGSHADYDRIIRRAK